MNYLLRILVLCCTLCLTFGRKKVSMQGMADKFTFNLQYGIFDKTLRKYLHNKTQADTMKVLIKNAFDKQLVSAIY